jgi:hypothetical protein
MNPRILLLAVAGAALATSGCESDDPHEIDGETRSVAVVTTRYPDESAPYYLSDNRRYYRSGRRYVYYDTQRRPYYVTALPARARYITPAHREVRVLDTSDPYHRIDSPAWPR